MKYITKYFIFGLILLLFQITVTSCYVDKVDKKDTSSLNNDILDFNYIENDDVPLLYNAMDGSNEIIYYDGCIYFFNGGSSGRQENHSTLYRLNVKTGNMTTVCTDPLCGHNSPECPFYSMLPMFYLYKNKIYYGRTFFLDIDRKDTGFYSDFVSFNIENSKLKQYKVYSEDSPEIYYSKELYVDEYRFYYDVIVDDKTNKNYFAICRMNLEDGSVEILKKDNSFNENANTTMNLGEMFLFSVGQRIYFIDGKGIYSTDFNMNDRQKIISSTFIYSEVFTDGEYIYWGESEDKNNINLQTLYRARLDGSGKISLNIKTENWQLTSKYIYYLNPQKTTIGKNGMKQRPDIDIVLNNNEIRRAAHDGSSNETVFSLIQDDVKYEIYSYTCVGNYIYAAYHTYTDGNKDGVIEDNEYYQSTDAATYTILRIDVTTGNLYYIHCGTEEN